MNFTRAAEDLQLSQPALSRSIVRLESELGQPVFERQTRTVEMTDAGRVLQVRAQQILALIDDTRAEITNDGETDRIRIGAIPTIAPYFVPPLLRSFATVRPKAELIVTEEVTERVLQRCQQGEVDCALVSLPISARHLEVEVLFDEELELVLAANHPLAGKKSISFADVQSEPFVLLDETHCLSDAIVSFCKQRSVQPVWVERTSQLMKVEELVALQHGISFVPAMASALDQSPRRVYRHLAKPRPTRTVALVWNPYRFQSRLWEAFKDHTRRFDRSKP